VQPRREAAEQAVKQQSTSKRRRRAGVVILGGAAFTLYWLAQLGLVLGGNSGPLLTIQDVIGGLIVSVFTLIAGVVLLRRSNRV
jgi:hypothetical protein